MHPFGFYNVVAALLLAGACTTPAKVMDPLPEPGGTPETPGDSVRIAVSATVVTEIARDGARFSASFVNAGNETIIERGFCYSTVDPPTINDQKATDGAVSPEFSIPVTGLSANTFYATRAYAIASSGTIYGTVEVFRTMNDGLASFVAPSYADDYSREGISSWGNRARWNLANVHDPTVEKCGDYFYMYATDASYGNVHAGRGHFPYRRSRDLVNWEFLGMAMSETPPAWIKDSLNSIRGRLGLDPIANPTYGYWAPVVRKVGEVYRMYYSIPVDNYIATGKPNTTANFDNSWTERAFIGLMETSDLAANNWEDKGMVVYSATDRGGDWSRPNLNNWSAYFKWNAIDPSLIIAEGRHWLIYGSWHSGIVALELDPATGKPLHPLVREPDDFGALVARRSSSAANRWQGQEAPEIIYNPETGFYYLFLAYDELSVAYNTRVCRSASITGPYLGYNGADITAGADCFPVLTHPYRFNDHPGWVGISHCCVFRDGDRWFYASQGRLPANANGNPNSNAIMMGHVREIVWTEDGWPVVMPERYAGVPQEGISENEIVGKWENIILSYSYGQQRASSELILTADKQVSGAIAGSWSYDSFSGILVIGNYRLHLRRGLDWEASPRVPTLVYAGLTPQGASIWGKKTP